MTTDVDAVQVVADGVTYRLVVPDRGSDYIQGWVSQHAAPYEHPMLQDMAHRLRDGDVVVDVGANIGNHTVYLAAVVRCRVEAFEPDPTLTSAIVRSAEANGLTDLISVHTVALGAGVATGALVRPDDTNIGTQHVELGAGDVQVVPLDQVDVRRPVRALKIDVEGMELDVLRGAVGVIEEDRPVLYVECATEAAFAAVAAWLDERGFGYWETFNATPTHLFVPVEALTAEQLSRRLLLKTVRDGFRSADALNGIRARLTEANVKYRTATRAYEVLKHELDTARAALGSVKDDLAGAELEGVRRINQVEELAHRAERQGDELRGVRAELDGARAELDGARAELDGARAELGGVQDTMVRAEDTWRAELARAQDERGRLEGELAEAVAAVTDRDRGLAAVHEQLDDARVAAALSESTLGAAEVELGDLRRATAFAEGERDAARGRTVEVQRDRDELAVELRSLREEADRLRADLSLGHEHLGAAREQVQEREDQLHAARQHVLELEDRVRQVEGERQEAWSAVDRLERSSEALAHELGDTRRRAEQLEEELAQLGDRLTGVGDELVTARAAEAARGAEVARVRDGLTQQGEQLTQAHLRVDELAGAVENAERERDAARGDLARHSLDRAERAGELRALRGELASAREELVEVTVRLRAQENRAAELDGSVAAAWAETGDLTQILSEHRGEAAATVAALRADASTLRVERDDAHAAAAGSAARAADAGSARESALVREQAAQVREREALDREAQALARLRELRGSATFRAGKEVSRASTSLTAAFALPVRLWRIAHEQGRIDRMLEASLSASVRSALPPSTPIPAEAVPPVAETALEPTTTTAPVPSGAGNPMTATAAAPAASAPRPRAAPVVAPLRVAAIVDEFTGLSLAPDCELHHLTPTDWEAQLQAAQPQLLFVESAWRGKDGSWHNTVGRFPAELRQIVAWCAARGVPTAFWNKEDPVHYATFLTTARAFDHVFTTDLDCVGRYKSALDHDRVYLLPFACQPRNHHPIESYPRKDAFSFAGSYYRRYPERTRDLDSFLENLPTFRPVEIFDRNFGGDHEDYMFPEGYRRHIVGTLPPEDVARAYKGYRFGINLNSVKQSQTMFARRVFELLASNTITVSNFSRGVRLMFGDLVLTTDSGADAVRRLEELGRDEDDLDRLRLAALRSVMSQHTYSDRLAYVAAKAGVRAAPAPPVVVLLAHARTNEERDRLVAGLRRQRGASVRGLLLVDAGVERQVEPGITMVRADAMSGALAADSLGDAGLVGVLHPDDYYGPHYAFDLALAARYSDADVFGKRARYRLMGGEPHLVDRGAEYRRAGRLPVRTSLMRVSALENRTLGGLVESAADGVHEAGLDQVALDRFGYCQDGAWLPDTVSVAVDDLPLDVGMPVTALQALAEASEPLSEPGAGLPAVDAEQLSRWFVSRERPAITHSLDESGWLLESTLADGDHDYLYAGVHVLVRDLWNDAHAEVFVDTTPGLRLQMVFVFLDEAGQRLGNFFALAHQNARSDIPTGAVSVRVAVRLLGPGKAAIRRIVLGQIVTEPEAVAASSRDLVLTNHYPAYDHLYRNGFVHSRVRGYRSQGTSPEVFRLRENETLRFSEFEGVDVVTGSSSALLKILTGIEHRSVMVHFLNRPMWSVLSSVDPSVRVVIWLHGADVNAWWRRRCNFRTEDEVEAAKAASAERMAFWQEVFERAPRNVHFVFVSQYLADVAMEDTGVHLADNRYSVVHNPIDETVFTYTPKDPEQRLRILSIRPFASRVYANDLTVAAINHLRDEPWFDELEFLIVGDGPLFEETVEPLRGLANVTLNQGFLSQHEIAALHKDYGVFLVPTRWDSHGVSRAEAMSSGLVPISCAVAAVPEFVDEASGILVPAEDADGLASAIGRLRDSPDLFRSLSAGAAERVRAQSRGGRVILQELALLGVTAPHEQNGD